MDVTKIPLLRDVSLEPEKVKIKLINIKFMKTTANDELLSECKLLQPSDSLDWRTLRVIGYERILKASDSPE